MTMLEQIINQTPTIESSVTDDVSVFSASKQYSFFQINQLLHRYLNKQNAGEIDDSKAGFSDSRKKHTVRYKSNPSLSFPSADIENIRLWAESDKEFAEVVVNFMGLFGPSSPLPAYFTERILHSEPDDTSVQDFLDLFNHRILDLLQRVWEKYRYYQCYDNGGDSFSQRMFSLIGITHVELCEYSDLQWSKLMPYAGLIALKVTNVEKVSKIVEGYFGINNVTIEQCVLRQVDICDDQLNQMGIVNCTLGNDLVLGESVLDRMGKICIHLQDLSVDQFNQFLPGGKKNKPLKQLISFLMTDQFDVEIRLQAKDLSHICSTMSGFEPESESELEPGAGVGSMMGWNTCLGEPVDNEHYHAVI
ncbi:MAG: type VI secretion system baseplate subunit TssG [Moraxellaceae bacterium]|nr:MAG: type VI secretion system baseplate subunit TssG [Moraxellaceae bacterium]